MPCTAPFLGLAIVMSLSAGPMVLAGIDLMPFSVALVLVSEVDLPVRPQDLELPPEQSARPHVQGVLVIFGFGKLDIGETLRFALIP